MDFAVLNNNKISLADVLRDFDRGLLGKTAEELEATDEAVPAYGMQPSDAPAVPPQQMPVVNGGYPDDGEYDDNYDYEGEEDEEGGNGHSDECECEVCNMQDALDELGEKQDEAVDAARVLRDMADQYIDRHDEAIAKEASLFGELFAKSACEYMNRNATFGKTAEYDEAYALVKQAVDEAYMFTLQKLAADEAFVAAAQAVSDSAAAARALVENLGNNSEGMDPEAEAGRAAAEAYNETMAQMQGGEEQEMSPEEQQAAAQGAYDEASQQIAAQQPQPDMAAVSQNAYDQAMGQIADQQQQQMPQQGYGY